MTNTIIFYFSGNGEVITLPINPGVVKVERKGQNKEKEVLNLGEINILRTPGLRSLKISSYFPQAESILPTNLNVYSVLKSVALWKKERYDPEYYVSFFTKLQEEKKPLKLVITDLDFSMMMAVERFTFTRKAGEHNDIYFELSLKEWVRYGATKVTVERDANGKITKVTKTELTNTDAELGIVTIPSKHEVSEGEKIWEIARRLTGDGTNYKGILSSNMAKGIIGSGLENLAGKTLEIPAEVRKDANNRISRL
ncbi:phage baseplate protein [Bacteroides sp.]|uniref:phage baseplate protein n=1 Tax=Bacteroides sp. TaxID=29523 RepID=UPI002616E326|nr:hypothetical protein [Bacteroides sp.]MDD3039758.1 hypothetical protein [Bacteroides sp.]